MPMPGGGGKPPIRRHAPAAQPPGRPTPGRPGVAALGLRPLHPSTVATDAATQPSAPTPALPLDVTLRQTAHGAPGGVFVGRGVPRRYAEVGLHRYFLSMLPGLELVPWHRGTHATRSELVLDFVVNPTFIFRREVYTVPANKALILFCVQQDWMQQNYNMYGGAPPASGLGYHDQWDNADGALEFIPTIDGAAATDVSDFIVDPTGPLLFTRIVSGYTKLHCNLLDMGQHPTALFLKEGQTLGIQIRTYSQPTYPIDWVWVTFDGYTCTMDTLRRAQQLSGISF